MNKFNFDKVIQNVNQMKQTLPKILANDAQRFFGASFSKQGWEDTSLQSWKPRKKETKKSSGKAILVGTGRLRRAVMQSAKEVSFERIRFEVDLPYAQILNEGGTMHNGGTMPKRQFIGDSKALRVMLEKKINLAVEKIWRV